MTGASEDLGTISVGISLGTYGNKVVEVRKGVMGSNQGVGLKLKVQRAWGRGAIESTRYPGQQQGEGTKGPTKNEV